MKFDFISHAEWAMSFDRVCKNLGQYVQAACGSWCRDGTCNEGKLISCDYDIRLEGISLNS